MRLVVSILILFAAQTVMAQTQIMGIPSVPPANPAPQPSPGTESPRLPPVQEKRPAPQPAQDDFVKCSEGSTSDASIAARMFTQILGYPDPFEQPIENRATGDSFTIFSRGNSLKATVSGYTVDGSVCKLGADKIRVYLVYGSYQFHFVASKVGRNTVHLRQTRSDYGSPIEPGNFSRAQR